MTMTLPVDYTDFKFGHLDQTNEIRIIKNLLEYLNEKATAPGQLPLTVTWEPVIALKIEEMKAQSLQDRGNRPFMVALVGIPGAGKSTSAWMLSKLLPKSVSIPMDG